jgi:hypothetical protein
MRHAGVREGRPRIYALPVKTGEKSRRSRAVEATIVEAKTNLLGIRQKILASEATKRKIHPSKAI